MAETPSEGREKILQRRMATCRHFTGIQNERCEVGVLYASVKDTSTRPYKFPCLDPGCASLCAAASYHTREEAEARDAEIAKIFERIVVARAAIVAANRGRAGGRGTLTCPCCNSGTLAYTVSGYNGHIWARCSTEGCVSWIE